MSKVHVSLRREDGTPTRAPISGAIRFAPSKRRTAGADVILPAGFDAELVDGEVTVELAATGPDWCWMVIEPTKRGLIRHVIVPYVGDEVLEYSSLPDVDPSTLEPSPEALAGWTATLDEVRALRDDAVAVIPLLEPTIAAAQAAKDAAAQAVASIPTIIYDPVVGWIVSY